MGVSKKTVIKGNVIDRPQKGDVVVMSYTGYIYDRNSRKGGRGALVDSSAGRGDLTTKLNGSSAIRGWEIGVLYANGGMSLGEKAVIKIPWQCAYGEKGFLDLVPPKADLIFDVELKAINGKYA